MAKVETPAETTPEESTVDEQLLVAAANMNIERYVPVRKAGHYDDQVQTLKRMDEETGFQNVIKILVPSGDEKKHKKWFGDSARAFDRSARIVNGDLGEPTSDGTFLQFVLTDKVERTPAKPKPATDEDTPTAA